MVATRTGSLPDCRPLLADPDDLTLVFRPVVDLAGATVAGYEALARFPGTAGPDVWFAAAAEAGLAAEVEALLVHKALARMPWRPPGTFLLVPVRAGLLDSRPVQDAFATRGRLDGLVVEVRPAGMAEPEASAPAIGALRARGAVLALGAGGRIDTGNQFPDVVALGRDTVAAHAGADASGAIPGSPLLLADGIDSPDDLTAALRCDAALGRGWLFGVPSSAFVPLTAPVTELVRTRSARLRIADPVLPLVQPVRQVPSPAPAVELDPDGAPAALLLAGPSGTTWRRPVTLSVLPTAGRGEALRLALSRPAEHRHDPVLCADESGRPLGLIRVADLVRATPRFSRSPR
jgi:EAL domain-containing protein (putative c-di-GMP-specific phosphodiesterase class I)